VQVRDMSLDGRRFPEVRVAVGTAVSIQQHVSYNDVIVNLFDVDADIRALPALPGPLIASFF
jgi:hypothetical protein